MKSRKLTLIIIGFVSFFTFLSCGDDPPITPITPKDDPVLTKIEPTTGIPGDLLRLYGKNFGAQQGTSYVKYGDLIPPSSNYSLWSDTLIIMTVPQNALTGYIKVIVGSKETEQIYFTIGTVVGDPFISRISPDKAYPGDTVKIEGANFLNSRDTSYIYFMGKKLNNVNYVTWVGSKIIFTVPADAVPGTGKVKVVVGSKSSLEINFTVKQQEQKDAPVIEYINPSTALVGDTIEIHGSKFSDIRKNHNGFAVIGGKQVKEPEGYVDWKDELILAVVPQGAQTGKMYVNKDGMKSNEVDFTIGTVAGDKPKIISLSKTSARPNEFIDINGEHFGPNHCVNCAVYFGGAILSRTLVASWKDTKISIQIPSDALPGSYNIVITVEGIASNTESIMVYQQKKNLIETVLITAGSFTMGTGGADDWANPAHQVTITRDFYMGKYEVTQKQWATVYMASSPSYKKDTNNPVEQVPWVKDASDQVGGVVEWCNAASKRDGFDSCYTIVGDVVTCDFTKNGYRLPTEAEWEYACRAGSTDDVNFTGNIDDYAWTRQNSNTEAQHVGLKLPNQWGLYDMNGNVAEWCWDWLDVYSGNSVTNPTGPTEFQGNGKIVRGGSYLSTVEEIKSWARADFYHTSKNNMVGFRVVRTK